jgi:1,4-dihydroxy-2-naphthoate octaprenyltransferase
MGKHIDKLPYDRPAGTHTLPVLLGEGRAKAITQAMMIAYYIGVTALVVVGELPWPALVTFAALPMLIKTMREYAKPKPTEAPKDNPVWPLWWTPLAFLHTRRAGGLLILGLLGWAIWTAVR